MNNYQTIQSSSIACIFVLYYPKLESLDKLVSLSDYGYPTIVVINGINSEGLNKIASIDGICVIHNKKNIGLATALNQGVASAFNQPKVEFVALFDQDSEFAVEMPQKLANELQENVSHVACIAPMLIDNKAQGASYKQHNSGVVRTIPTSGTIISKNAYEDVGPMLDALFIDSIDHEWCFRAASKGWKIFVSKKLTMSHDMGDKGLNWLGQYKPVYKNPIRHFYIIRNSIYLAKLSYIPLSWRLIEILKILRRIMMYLWVSSDRTRTLKLIAKGINDGLHRRLGPLLEN